MKKTLLFLTLCSASLFGQGNSVSSLDPDQQKAYAAVANLRPRQPNWRTEIVKSYPNGNLEIVLLYEPEAGLFVCWADCTGLKVGLILDG